jgi:hypothetical protein
MEKEVREICQNCKSKKKKHCYYLAPATETSSYIMVKFTPRKGTCASFLKKGGK